MNIFYLSPSALECAQWAIDKHVVKMILESAQMLSTAHRVLDGHEYIDDGGKKKVKRWRLSDNVLNTTLYSATHVNHRCTKWARETINNYDWLWTYLYHHCKEYTHRYGKVHKIERDGLLELLKRPPLNIPYGYFTEPPCAMDTKYLVGSDPVASYKQYYKYGKKYDSRGRPMHVWTKRETPEWIKGQHAELFD